MLAVVIVLVVVVALVCVVVTGLLRSHADILRALHQLGAGVADPAAAAVGPQPVGMPTVPGAAAMAGGGLAMPSVPAERDGTSVHDISGTTPGGDAIAVSVTAAPLTLFAFLSSGCSSCQAMWAALGDPAQVGALPGEVRVVAVTKGPEMETPDGVAARAPRGITVVMSTEAWGDYEVPGSPFFILVDGRGRRIGEGVANQFSQIVDLVRRADADTRPPGAARGGGGGSVSRAGALGLDGAEREAANDAELAAAGILPGDPSLYPRSLDDVFAATESLAAPRRDGR